MCSAATASGRANVCVRKTWEERQEKHRITHVEKLEGNVR